MKQKEITRLSMLIAKFEGLPATEEKGKAVWYDHDGQRDCEYHTSFEWIMRVLEQIATDFDNQYLISKGVVSIYQKGKFMQLFNSHEHDDDTVLAAFKCVGYWVENIWPSLNRKIKKHDNK